jgi:hypothetical protein
MPMAAVSIMSATHNANPEGNGQRSGDRFNADSECAQSENRATMTSQGTRTVSGRDHSRSNSFEGDAVSGTRLPGA